MNQILRVITISMILCMANSSFGADLKNDKSKLLLDNIRQDISNTLSSIADIEADQDWTVYLSYSNGRLVRMGVVIEPSTETVLSVAADGTAKAAGLLAGDIIKKVSVNGRSFTENLSSAQFTHGDELNFSIVRDDKLLELKHQVESSFVPNWQLYSAASDTLVTTLKNADAEELLMNLQSSKSITLLKKLEARINYTLSEIYKLESRSENLLELSLSKVARVRAELGVSVDKNNKVLSIKSGSSGDLAGLMVGDVIDGFSLLGKQDMSQKLALIELKPAEAFYLRVNRNGKTVYLEGIAKPIVNPSWVMDVNNKNRTNEEGCGIITVFFDTPFTEDIYKAQITEVDGELLPSSIRNDSIKLSAGHHKILIHDNIPDRLKRRSSRGKLIEFLVVPNKRYFLGAKYYRSERFSSQGKYWQPYVWKVEDYECSPK